MRYLIAAFGLAVITVFATPTRAALVYDGWDTGPGGLSTPYPTVNPEVYAGLIELNYGGSPILVMSADRNTLSHLGEYWPVTLYTYAEVQAGAPVRFTPAQYARAAYLLDVNFPTQVMQHVSISLRQWATMQGSDTLAFVNTNVWEITSATSSWSASDLDLFDWSQTMTVASGGPGRDEYLIPLASQGLTLASGTVTIAPSVPLPAAAWLLGSGLLGLVSVARKRRKSVTPLS
ncbi:MAG: hypothetical protein A2937_03550 [Candidatus Yonathbacteria bacterium RIFCSPLOWO2_01_FULL_47_33b]|uniref:Uncharacterized protein n=1 Tax=Candidatus Yonathbacteria bacterium RIFCSPLOWO2_01_FULL_47_33b TaxID=1802727 RepID=A0A1G2SEG6_9BACT|nr:MAG: hypothetical protein A2937_03550 [Candidatus Yonathbacteria bacterium RIFCSPLOWO2_01_FULL_47_33b]